MTNAKKSSTHWPSTLLKPAEATRNGSVISSIVGGQTTAKNRPTTCGGGVGRSGDDEMLEMANRLGARHDTQKLNAARDRVAHRRHGSRADDGMWVATIAALLMVFAVGVVVGWLFA